jgi:5-methyltetrahydrofolate--homocysteine methyltransferase
MPFDLAQLTAAGPVVTDGAWGTQFLALGLASGECPDGWNLAHPERVLAVARAYVEAGSQVILTNTFRSNRIAMGREGLAEQVGELNRRGVAISREAAAGRALVFASMGPSGKLLLSDEVSEEELDAAFSEQADAMAAAGADAILVETMCDIQEARIAIAAARRTGLPVAASMVFDTGKNKDRTMMGTTPEQAASALEEAGAAIIGANCGCGVEAYLPVCRRLAAATDRPVWIKANAGAPEFVDGRPVYRMTAEEYAAWAPRLVEAGARFVGGCCGTSPDFIRAVRRNLGTTAPCA